MTCARSRAGVAHLQPARRPARRRRLRRTAARSAASSLKYCGAFDAAAQARAAGARCGRAALGHTLHVGDAQPARLPRAPRGLGPPARSRGSSRGACSHAINNPESLRDHRFCVVLHQVRHPLRVISSMLKATRPGDRYWQWILAEPAVKRGEPLLLQATRLWVAQNERLEGYADARFRVEDTAPRDVCGSETERVCGSDGRHHDPSRPARRRAAAAAASTRSTRRASRYTCTPTRRGPRSPRSTPHSSRLRAQCRRGTATTTTRDTTRSRSTLPTSAQAGARSRGTAARNERRLVLPY